MAFRDWVRNLHTTPYDKYYILLAMVALAAGIFIRFWDLSGAPLAVDEYYFGTSILNIAERGLPQFACGGFYTRGVLIQYMSLPLLFLGASLEFATRFWPAVASLLSIAAVWRIARLAGGVKTAAVAVILVSLSAWEIEFARFGRMYAPFQAVFLWYVYFQILHLIRGQNKARWAYLGLSAVSIFVYAGASFLLAFNFLALVWSGKRWSASHLIVATFLLVFGVASFMIDFRDVGVPIETAPPTMEIESGLSLPLNIPVLPGFIVPIFLLGLFFVGYWLLRYRSNIRASHPSIIYWALAAVCLCFGLFGLGVGLIFAGLLFQLPSPLSDAGLQKTGVPVRAAIMLGLWVTALMTLFGAGAESLWAAIKYTLSYVFNYPDLYHYVVRPWLQAIPVTTVILAFLAAPLLWAFATKFRRQGETLSVQRYLAAALILLLMLSAFFYQPYTITRYTYFLYPLILVLVSISIVYCATSYFGSSRKRAVVTVLPILLLFVLTEDFRLSHLVRINEPEIRYRMEYGDALAGHYYTRWDYRAAAFYVNERLAPLDSVIIFDQTLPYYLDRTSGIFVREGTKRQSMIWGCGGKKELWSNATLLDTESLQRLIDRTNGSVWLIMRTGAYRWRDSLESSLPGKYRLEPEFVSQDAHLAVYELPSDLND